MLNYVILSTHILNIIQCGTSLTSVHPIISLSYVSPYLSVSFQNLYVGHEQVLLTPLNRPFPLLMHYSWASTCQPRMSFILYGNLVSYHCFTLLAIMLLCWAISKIVYVSFVGLLRQYTVPALTVKGTRLASFAKRLQVHTMFPLQLRKKSQ